MAGAIDKSYQPTHVKLLGWEGKKEAHIVKCMFRHIPAQEAIGLRPVKQSQVLGSALLV